MSTSQNGYTANDMSLIVSTQIPGTTRKVNLRRGAPGELLAHFAGWFDKNIESVDGGILNDWGYANRAIRGQTSGYSNHASGTALDLNANYHPLGRVGTFTPAQTQKIRTQLAGPYENAIRWGGNYKNRKDEMHFEIIVSPEKCAAVLKKLTSPVVVNKPQEDTVPLPLKFSTPMPANTQRAHPSYTTGDAKAAIDGTAKKALGPDRVRALDFNVQVIKLMVDGVLTEVAIGAHWATLGANGWTAFVNKDGKLQKFTAGQLKWTIQKFVDLHGKDKAAFYMLRRKNGEHPFTLYDAMKYAKKKGVALTPELKSTRLADRTVMKRVVDHARALDYPFWPMTLLSMPKAKEKVACVRMLGQPIALILGDQQGKAHGKSPIANWPAPPTYVWAATASGRSSANRWIKTWRDAHDAS